MSKNFVQSALIRDASIGLFRIYSQAQFWRTGPRIFVNSLPKSGTHLLTAELEELPGLANSRLHIEARKINAKGGFRDRVAEIEIDVDAFAKFADQVRPGQVFSSHLPWAEGLEQYLVKSDIKTIFMIRDPRDILLSNLHYIKGLRRHFLHDHFVNELKTDEDRLRFLIVGNEAPYRRPLAEVLQSAVQWKNHSAALVVRFEDLVGAKGGGSDTAREETIKQICIHCGLPPAEVKPAVTKSTPTLRKGRAHGWHDDLPKETAELIATTCGDLLEQLNYPRS